MDLKNQKVLVTGGTGFVGSHLVERLVREGCRVRVLGNYKSQPDLGNLAFLSREVLDEIDAARFEASRKKKRTRGSTAADAASDVDADCLGVGRGDLKTGGFDRELAR